jgi:hypothetical protein
MEKSVKHDVTKNVLFNEIRNWSGDFVHFSESETVEILCRVPKIQFKTNGTGKLKNTNKNSAHENVT